MSNADNMVAEIEAGLALTAVREEKKQAALTPDTRPTITVKAGELHNTLREAKASLASLPGIYNRAGTIAQIVQRRVRSELGDTLATDIVDIPAGPLRALLSEAAIWQTTKGGRIDPPETLARSLVQDHLSHKDPLLDLVGVVQAPFLRRDGTVAQANVPGYDAATALYIEPGTAKFLPVDDAHCTKADAVAALARLDNVIAAYEMDDLSRAVALASFLTPFVRMSLPMVPGFAIDAPVAGSGKTKLACLPGILATGKVPPTIAAGQGHEEQDKQFNSALLGGRPFIVLDNITDANWGTGLLNSTLTSAMVEVRPFGSSNLRELVNVATVVVTGNNLSYCGDVGRRFLTCRITPSVKDPAMSTFAFDPVEFTQKDRTILVHAALTILRAFALHGQR